MIEITEKRHTGKRRGYYVIERPRQPFLLCYTATAEDCAALPHEAERLPRADAVSLVKQSRTLASVHKNKYSTYICPAAFWTEKKEFFEKSDDFIFDLDAFLYERKAEYIPAGEIPWRPAHEDYLLTGNFTRAQRRTRRKYEAKAKRTAACGLTVEQFEKLKRYAAENNTTICAILHAYIMTILSEMEDN